MPTILQINSTANWGSTGRIAEQINLAAQAKGWETYIAYGRNVNPSASELIPIGDRIGQGLHLLESRLLDRHGLGSKWATKQLVNRIERIHPDIIHLHNIHGYYLNYPILFDYLKRANIPVVWTLHDCWAFTGHCSHFVTAKCERWREGCYNCPLKSKEYPVSWGLDRSRENWLLKQKSFRGVKSMVLTPVSEWLSDLAKESFLGAYPVHCIHNGIDLNMFRPIGQRDIVCRRWGIDSRKYIVLGVASVWEQRKGLNDFITLSRTLSKDAIIVLVGVTAKQKAHLPHNILGVSRTNDVTELAELYTAADVYVNPTYADTFPTTNLEALACGTPVVTYRTGGSPEAIDELTGIVVEQGDLFALASAIDTVCKNGKAYYSDACRKRAVQHFNKDDRFNDYIRLYEEMLK